MCITDHDIYSNYILICPMYDYRQGVKKMWRLSWLTNSAFVYEPKCGGRGGGGGCGVLANE